MKTSLLRFLFVALVLALPLLAAPMAYAQEGGEGEAEEHGGIDFLGGPEWATVQDETIWALAGVAVFAVVLGVLYLFKRKIGAFPEHPTWVAPISIMRAGDLPGDEPDDSHEDHLGHEAPGGHGDHAPAH